MSLFFLRILSFIFLLTFCSFTKPVFAGVSLSVNPIQGGTGIKFERVLPGLRNVQQVQIRVSSNEGKQYQVFQRVYEPITNERGQILNLQAVEVGGVPGSNTAGTLYMQNSERLTHSEQLVYTSAQTGESDGFILAYVAVPEAISGSGVFRGRIVYTVRIFGGGQDESIVDFSLESAPNFKAAVVGGHDPRGIRIKDTDNSENKADFVKVSFSDNGAQEVKVYQEIPGGLTNETGQDLPLEAIRISLQGNSAHLHPSDVLSQNRTMIYSGSENEDAFAVYFVVDSEKLQSAEAGNYKGKIKYTIEGALSQEFYIDVECEIQPIFTISVELPAEGVGFNKVLANSPPQEKQVVVTVRSNIHKPYQVLQNMLSYMTNENGKEFDKKYFTFKVDLASEQKGRTKFTDYAPVDVGEYPIYYSDAKGSPVVFTVVYRLQGYFDMSPGNFSAPLKYSLNQN